MKKYVQISEEDSLELNKLLFIYNKYYFYFFSRHNFDFYEEYKKSFKEYLKFKSYIINKYKINSLKFKPHLSTNEIEILE